jgi:hypothetical protein
MTSFVRTAFVCAAFVAGTCAAAQAQEWSDEQDVQAGVTGDYVVTVDPTDPGTSITMRPSGHQRRISDVRHQHH